MTDEKEKNEVVVSSHEEYNKTIADYEERDKIKEEKIEGLKREVAKKDRIILENKDEKDELKEKNKILEDRCKKAEDKILASLPYGHHRSANESKEQKFEREFKEGLEKFDKNSVSNRINK